MNDKEIMTKQCKLIQDQNGTIQKLLDLCKSKGEEHEELHNLWLEEYTKQTKSINGCTMRGFWAGTILTSAVVSIALIILTVMK